MMRFQDYFDKNFLKSYFFEHLLHKDGGGRDGMKATRYKESGMLDKDLPVIHRKCLAGEYPFTPYAEKLMLKGRDKYPRVISIPTIRDRLTLGALHQYLNAEIGLKFRLNPPAWYISRIRSACEAHSEKIYYTKVDFSDFYGRIDHAPLMEAMPGAHIDPEARRLVLAAIQTPTVAPDSSPKSKAHKARQGIPQGLSISNFLAAKYMERFDDGMKEVYGDRYVRYVDDILILTQSRADASDALNQIWKLNSQLSLKVDINRDKTKIGCLDDEPDGIEFLGYRISRHGIGVRKSTMLNFEKKLTAKCARLRNEYRDDWRRPLCLQRGKDGNDNAFIDHVNLEMQMTISGVKSENRAFGWLPYFRNITEVSQLHRLDYLVKKMFAKTGLDIESSFVRSFYDYKSGNTKCIVDLDAIDTVDAKRTFLLRKGVLNPNRPYSADQVNALYKRVVHSIKKDQKKDIRHYS